VEIALTYIHGIGRSTARKLLEQAQIDFSRKTDQLTDAEVAKIREVIDQSSLKIEGDLRREISMNIKRLMDLDPIGGCDIDALCCTGSAHPLPTLERAKAATSNRWEEEIKRGKNVSRKNRAKKKERRNIQNGVAHIQSTLITQS